MTTFDPLSVSSSVTLVETSALRLLPTVDVDALIVPPNKAYLIASKMVVLPAPEGPLINVMPLLNV
jgi:hypothetical protein